MSKPDKNSGIPLPIIILGYIFSVPAGIVLTLLHLFLNKKGDDGAAAKTEVKLETAKNNPRETGKSSAESENRKKAKETGAARPGICVPALVLGILTGVFALCGLMILAEGIFSMPFQQFLQADYISDTAVMLVLAAGCFIPAQFFSCRHKRRNVIRSIIGRRETIFLNQLAAAADLSPRKLRRELQGMIDKGEFGDEAYIDMSTGRFMRHPDESEENAEYTPAAEMYSREEVTDTEAGTDEFRSIILQIRKLNDDIKDYAVSERIYRIEEHTQNIFDYVTAHPEAMPQIRSFMNYYLPTTLKLLDSYSRIEQVGVAGENMKKSKENIERILDMLVVGFEQQVDQLFRNESMDISSEIKVLEAMMKQDGLDGRNDFDPGYSDDLTSGGTAAQSAPDKKA